MTLESGGETGLDVTASNFAEAVMARSAEVPVVVDFWAEWCAPCRMLGPILESEVAAMNGAVVLAKINTETDSELAAQFDIKGIPAVKAFRNGKVVAEFVGARPAPSVREWLAALIPSPLEETLTRASEAARAGNWAQADTILAGIDPDSVAAQAIPSLRRRLAFFADVRAYGGEEAARAALDRDGRNLDARYALASAEAARWDFRAALENFLEIVARDRKFKDDGARLGMLALFDQLGADNELARDVRRRLQIVL